MNRHEFQAHIDLGSARACTFNFAGASARESLRAYRSRRTKLSFVAGFIFALFTKAY